MWVVFDYGGVISRPQPERDVAALAAAAGGPVPDFLDAYWARREAYDRADLDAEAFWKGVTNQLGRSWDPGRMPELVRLDIRSWQHLRPGVVRLVDEVAASGHRLALLSNAPHEVAAGFASLPVARQFEHLLFSCDLRLVKPDPRCFSAALATLEAAPADVIFIDDRQDNVDAAAGVGISAIKFTTVGDLRVRLLIR
jgi:putative hydrolase of the HAD superfamily